MSFDSCPSLYWYCYCWAIEKLVLGSYLLAYGGGDDGDYDFGCCFVY